MASLGDVMALLLKFSKIVDKITRFAAILASVCILVLVLVGAANAITRYLSSINVASGLGSYFSTVQRVALSIMQAGGNGYLEIQMYLFAAVFMLGAAHVLKRNEHVRVDLVYGNLSPKGKIYIDFFGFVFFFFPAMFIILKYAIPFFWMSFLNKETSSNAAGLILWPVKALLPLSYCLLTLQGISECIKRFAALKGSDVDNPTYEKPTHQ